MVRIMPEETTRGAAPRAPCYRISRGQTAVKDIPGQYPDGARHQQKNDLVNLADFRQRANDWRNSFRRRRASRTKNPLYVGEVVYRGGTHTGEQEPHHPLPYTVPKGSEGVAPERSSNARID
jgi:hypothetical protein